MNTLATVDALRRHLDISIADDDGRLLHSLIASTRIIHQYTARRFIPYHAMVLHNPPTQTPHDELSLASDLLILDSLTIDGELIPLSDVRLVENHLLIREQNGSFATGTGEQGSIEVTGIWGFHDDYANAWHNSEDTVQDASLSATATTITVTDADANHFPKIANGGLPHFQIGQMLQIGSEWIRVLDVDTATNQLTVVRGMNSTTAQSHAQGTPIEIYEPMSDVEWACLRLAEWMLTERMGESAMPDDVREVLNQLHRVRV